jgi:hypothetical protein
MTLTELAQSPTPDPEEADLRSWDWLAALRAEERYIPWLAKRTSRAQRTVYGYARGELVPPLDWLREAAVVLGKEVAA